MKREALYVKCTVHMTPHLPPPYQVGPKHALVLVGLAILPCLISIARRPNPHRFAAAVAFSLLSGFMFGFHVHEKAILMTVIPLALDVHQGSSTWVKLRFLILKTVALWTLLPLLIS